ncbi:signal peptidase II [Clostridium lundense]|uniref:signal peptidase II n=1 Tax=Clostridium lundense TaxID=319475 RepID=UPI00047F2D80|nr:signal peptidase II [Clostridium lundense]
MKYIINKLKFDKVKLIFISQWFLYIMFEACVGNFRSYKDFFMSILPFIFFYIMAIVFLIIQDIKEYLKNLNTLINICFYLIVIEQIIKVVIRFFVPYKVKIPVLHDWLYIYSIINSQGCWINSRFKLGISLLWLDIINLISIVLIIQMYRFYISFNNKSFWIDCTFIMMISGAICSFIDKVFFGGSLDYIGLKGLFIIDLKDIYITLALCCFLVQFVEENSIEECLEMSFEEDINLLKNFINYSQKDIKKLKDYVKDMMY